jgi:F420-0:gamma-glutamyl ligase
MILKYNRGSPLTPFFPPRDPDHACKTIYKYNTPALAVAGEMVITDCQG